MKPHLIVAIFLLCIASTLVHGQTSSDKKNLQSFTGFFNFNYDEASDKIYLEVPDDKINQEFLYVHSLRTGLGSNDIGLDRGQLGDQAVVKFIKSGNKLLLLQPNINFRAITDNDQEKKSVAEAFAQSVLFGFEIQEKLPNASVIDMTPFLFLDAHDIVNRLKKGEEGTYKLEASRTTVWMERTKAFPKNCEFEAMLTFVGEPKGSNIASVAPDANSISVIQHISFVALPDANYSSRAFDTRSGSFSISYQDYSSPIWESLTKRLITRHRLEKKDPNAAISEAIEPIIYYLDPGTPEPLRTALLEGAQWWDQAFAAIGYKNAFQVKMLPDDADPMDVRYNVIQWVHRSTRGWSYGGSVIDPRTGEIIKGHVSLGSLRIRQDFAIAQALMNKPFATSDSNNNPMLTLALARIRQLAAHEVGHTLGFAHNYAASTNNRASVMDYPHPAIQLNGDIISFENAYATGIGDWDKVTVAYSYSDIPANTNSQVYLNGILEKASQQGLRYITDSDARAQSGAHSKAHLWDNGEDVSKELLQLLELRKKAIANFSEDNIRTNEPFSVLEDIFVPLYFYHRYQTEAVVKLVGGVDYNYAVKGDGETIQKTLPKAEQLAALSAVLQTVSAENLAIPPRLLALFPPRAFGYGRTRESFKSATGVTFDALGAAATASDETLSLLLNAERMNRIIQQHALDKNQLGLEGVLEVLNTSIFKKQSDDPYLLEVENTIKAVALQQVLQLVNSGNSSTQTKAVTNTFLDALLKQFKKDRTVFSAQLKREIEMYRAHPELFKAAKVPTIPDGSPIGTTSCFME